MVRRNPSTKKYMPTGCTGLTLELNIVLGLNKALRVFIGSQAVSVDDDVGWDRDAALLQGRPTPSLPAAETRAAQESLRSLAGSCSRVQRIGICIVGRMADDSSQQMLFPCWPKGHVIGEVVGSLRSC